MDGSIRRISTIPTSENCDVICPKNLSVWNRLYVFFFVLTSMFLFVFSVWLAKRYMVTGESLFGTLHVPMLFVAGRVNSYRFPLFISPFLTSQVVCPMVSCFFTLHFPCFLLPAESTHIGSRSFQDLKVTGNCHGG